MSTQPALLRRGILAADLAAGWLPRKALIGGTPRVIANGLPKAGTNLILRALVEGLGLRRARWSLYQETAPGGSGPTMTVGIDHPTPAAVKAVRRWLKAVAPGSVVLAHLPYDEMARQLFDDLLTRMVVMVRDPRDVAVSLVSYVLDQPQHFLHDRFISMPPDERLVHAIRGVDGSGRLLDLRARFDSVLQWQRWSGAMVTRFEDLVGPDGGGSATEQANALGRIATHVDVAMTEAQLREAAGSLFGGTRSFRRGQIGSWHEHFKPHHANLLKQITGDLLVELGYERSTDW
jgi:hypothetical protein